MQLYLLVSIIKCVFFTFLYSKYDIGAKEFGKQPLYGSMVGGSEGKLQLGKVVLSPVQNVLASLK